MSRARESSKKGKGDKIKNKSFALSKNEEGLMAKPARTKMGPELCVCDNLVRCGQGISITVEGFLRTCGH